MAQRICRLESPSFCAERLGKIYSSKHANFAARRNAPSRSERFTLGFSTRANLKNRLLFTPLLWLMGASGNIRNRMG